MIDGNDDGKIDVKEIEKVHQERLIYNFQFDSIDAISNIHNCI